MNKKENRKLLGTSDLIDEQQEINEENDNDNDDDEDDDINTFNQPEQVQRLDQIYKQALEQTSKLFQINKNLIDLFIFF